MAGVVCVDSNVAIWGLKRQCEDGQESNVEKAIRYFASLDRQKHKIALPVHALAEITVNEPDTNRAKMHEVACSYFEVLPFDNAAALCFSALLRKGLDERKAEVGVLPPRNELKIDMMIIATAIVRRVDRLVTNDDQLFRRASRFCKGTGVDVVDFSKLSFEDQEQMLT